MFKKLIVMKPGETGTISHIICGRRCNCRLINMGVKPGQKITMISRQFYGPAFILSGQTHIGIGYGMASKIIVEIDNA